VTGITARNALQNRCTTTVLTRPGDHFITGTPAGHRFRCRCLSHGIMRLIESSHSWGKTLSAPLTRATAVSHQKVLSEPARQSTPDLPLAVIEAVREEGRGPPGGVARPRSQATLRCGKR
jgi:hypothetical protein